MDFRIADTFTDSLAKLTGDEQKAVKTTAFDLQMNPASPSMCFHKLDRAKDTSHQIRMQADLLLGPEVSDVDGNVEERRGTVSIFNGPAPSIAAYATQDDEINAVGAWLATRNAEGVAPHEIGVFIRSEAEIDRACKAVSAAGLPYRILDERVGTAGGYASICPMHLAKGLEFRAVAVMACDDEIIPQQSRIEAIADSADLEEVYVTERHLLYVACTRARDHLLVTSVEPASEFLDDLRASSTFIVGSAVR